MRRYIEWKLDEREPINPADPLGNINIVGDRGIIKEKAVFLDSFFEAFVEGLNSLKEQSICSIEIIDEPHELIFSKEDLGYKIQYKEQSVNIYNITLFSNQLAFNISNFLKTLDKASVRMRKKKYDFTELRQFANKSFNEFL